jgi:excisionase family DNA binding protein
MAPVPSRATEFLTSDEVVETLESDPDLRRLAVACVLPAVRVGDEWLFRRSDLEAWIALHRVSESASGA